MRRTERSKEGRLGIEVREQRRNQACIFGERIARMAIYEGHLSGPVPVKSPRSDSVHYDKGLDPRQRYLEHRKSWYFSTSGGFAVAGSVMSGLYTPEPRVFYAYPAGHELLGKVNGGILSPEAIDSATSFYI